LKKEKLNRSSSILEGTDPMVGAGIILAAATLPGWASSVSAEDVTKPDDEKVNDEFAVTESLTGVAGDPKVGRKTFVKNKLNNRPACPANKEMSDLQLHGEVGPSLDGLASRCKPEQLRMFVINSKYVFGPATVMPGLYSLKVGEHVRTDLVGETILSAQQVEVSSPVCRP
jgi:sulfur-oxidizing protein SoxX